MGEPLKNPPLVEAACEFRWRHDSPWDWTIPGRLFEKLKGDFSVRNEIPRLSVLAQVIGKIEATANMVESVPDRIQFARPNGSAIVQAGPRMLSVNHLRPYETWESFRDLILSVYRRYSEVVAPQPLARIGLRYINLIERRNRDIPDILTNAPGLAGRSDRPITSFYQRYQVRYDHPSGMLIHQTGSQDTDSKKAIALDIDFVSEPVSGVDTESAVIQWLDQAHQQVEASFIDSIPAKLFQELKFGAT